MHEDDYDLSSLVLRLACTFSMRADSRSEFFLPISLIYSVLLVLHYQIMSRPPPHCTGLGYLRRPTSKKIKWMYNS